MYVDTIIKVSLNEGTVMAKKEERNENWNI